MGTEVAISFSSLRAQLENEKSSLFKIDENIKKISKIVQTSARFSNDRFNPSGDYARGGGRVGSRGSFPDTGKPDELLGKRKHETKTVFSRLSGRVQDSDGEEETGPPGVAKRGRVPSAVTRWLPSRAAVLRAQSGDEAARTRNRRMFGSLLGTLHKFRQEEITLQTKEEKKAQVERKIEEQARLEKEREQKERKTLFAERDHKKATIKALEAKMARVQEFEKWEESQKNLGNFILTKAKPHVYWLPKKMNEKATEKLTSSRKFHEKCMTKKRQELQDELQRIEQRCLRIRMPAKENHPDSEQPGDQKKEREESTAELEDDEKAKKRDKFATDADEVESEGDDRHDEEVKAECKEEESQETKMDTSMEQNEEKKDEETQENPQPAVESIDEVAVENIVEDSKPEDHSEEPAPENPEHS